MDDLFLHDFSGSQSPAPPEPSRRIDDFPTPRMGKPGNWRNRLLIIIFIVAAAALWIRYFIPSVTDAVETGYVTRIDRRGIVLKTWEGEMALKKDLEDYQGIYQRDFTFSVENDSLALALQHYQGSRLPVTITYKQFHGAVPWRGASRTIITAVRQP